MTTTSSWRVLDQAHQALRTVTARIPGDGWALRTPCEQWNVAQVLRHAAGDQLAYTAALDAAVHAWDIAVATGQSSPLSPDLAELLMPVAMAIVEPLRGFAYAPALEPGPGEDAAAALLRYLGRRPGWAR